MSAKPPAQIIRIDPARYSIGRGTSRRRDEFSHCRHTQKLTDPAARVVECRMCGAVLDPFTVLHEIACECDSVVYAYAERGKLNAHLELLRKMKSALSSQVRKELRDIKNDPELVRRLMWKIEEAARALASRPAEDKAR